MCPCYLWQARSKNCQFKYSEILLLQGAHIWEPEPLSLSFIVIAFSVTLYRLALHSLIPPLCFLVFASWLCSYLLPQYFNSDYVLFLSSAVFFPSLPLRFPGPHFLSLGEFWIRESFWCQAATILHVNKKDGWKHSESCTETFFQLVCHASFCCGRKESISFTAPFHHHHQRQQFVVPLILIFYLLCIYLWTGEWPGSYTIIMKILLIWNWKQR